MFLWGKLLGLIFGYWLAGFWGALLGCWVGHQFDNAFSRGLKVKYGNFQTGNQYQTKLVIFEASFAVMGYLAKADGRVSEQAIDCVRQIMQQMQLTASQQRKAIKLFNWGKTQNFNLDAVLIKLLRVGQMQPLILQHFVELQFKVVQAADQRLSANKQRILEYIAQRLGLGLFNTEYQNYRQAQAASKTAGLVAAYSELGVASTASDQEVKIAYRRLMSRYHPDKLASRAEATLLKAATQKTQQIKEAYEQIKAARGIG